LIVNGIVEQFQCSECDWAIILEEPFYHSQRAQQAAISKVKHWFLARDCSQFPKPGAEIEK